ncbi:MAG TPA: Gfo/Idh/MocA family oxidoreductase [Chitinophaga sp.]|uniref:Gfo/Idh/MocA family protein n=1 Tax=Chitinophaga sp. TaxID=1869181 RepID=UPI002B8093D6|nr:Gfo/Idh/MocA family oxidoreductase [Chitinophaga sp.]HVI45058.1 Gfo/Idh/MocA family oxidoreductase [Chitinophaga sp.]
MHISDRRRFLRSAAILLPAFATKPSSLYNYDASRVRLAFAGCGNWGRSYLSLALRRNDLETAAIYDNSSRALQQGARLCRAAGKRIPELTGANWKGYTKILERDDIDAVVIAAPWKEHYRMAEAALMAGKHVACGAVMGTTMEEHLRLVHLSRKTKRCYFTLDEQNYQRPLMAASQMAQAGVLGEVLHITAGPSYLHLTPEHEEETTPYPQYPVMTAMKMLDMDNSALSMQVMPVTQEYIACKRHPQSGNYYHVLQEDTLNMICLTAQSGQTLWLQHSTGNNRPLSADFRITGSKGRWLNAINSVQLNGIWQKDVSLLTLYDHPRWQQPQITAHALALEDFIQTLKHPQYAEKAVSRSATASIINLLAKAMTNSTDKIILPDFNTL